MDRRACDAGPASYAEAHRYDGAAIEHGQRDALDPVRAAATRRRDRPRRLALQVPHRAAAARAVVARRASVQAADRRLLKLFRAGHLERFRPIARRGTGSYPWTYHLGEDGHRLLQHAGVIAARPALPRPRRSTTTATSSTSSSSTPGCSPTAARSATRCSPGTARPTIDPPPGCGAASSGSTTTGRPRASSDPRPRLVRPDAVLEVAGDDRRRQPRLLLIEYDRTRRARQELREVPPLRRLPDLVVAPHAPRRPRSAAVRRLRLPRRRAARRLPRRRRPRAHRAPLAPRRRHPSATSTSGAGGSSSRPSSTRTTDLWRPAGSRCSRSATVPGRAVYDESDSGQRQGTRGSSASSDSSGYRRCRGMTGRNRWFAVAGRARGI